MKAKDIRELSSDELSLKLKDLKETMFRYRFQAATGQLDNPIKLRGTRRDIARILTVISEEKRKRNSLGDQKQKSK